MGAQIAEMNGAGLAEKHCVTCSRGMAALTEAEARHLLHGLPGWQVQGHAAAIRKRYEFADFAAALALVQKVAKIAEAEGHHPDIAFGWGYAEFTLTTHDIGGLHENDFIMAAKIEKTA